MKRKNTKLYQEIVNKYCAARSSVESTQKEIDEYYVKIGKAKKKFDSLNATPVMDDEIKEWYDGYTNIIQWTVGLMENNIKYDKERMQRSGEILIADYEENLDELYKSIKERKRV